MPDEGWQAAGEDDGVPVGHVAPEEPDPLTNLPAAADPALSPVHGESARHSPVPEVEHLTYPSCPPGRGVELYIIEDGGHEWPGDPGPDALPAEELDANHLMLQFFRDHPRP